MENINNIIDTTINSFDFTYCIIVNILTYIIVTTINTKNKPLDTWKKRIVLLGSIIIIGSVYYFTGSDAKLIINSSILAPVFWSWVMKPICKYFNIDYKRINLFD